MKPRYRKVGKNDRLVIPRPLRHRFKQIWEWCRQNPDALKVTEGRDADQAYDLPAHPTYKVGCCASERAFLDAS